MEAPGPEEKEAAPAELQAEAEPGFDLSDQDAALAWLESLAARQGAAVEELITRPEERPAKIPSWLPTAVEPEAALPEEEKPEEALPIAKEISAESQPVGDTQPVKIAPVQEPEPPVEAGVGFEEAAAVSEIAYPTEETPELLVSSPETAPERVEPARAAEEIHAPVQEEPELPAWIAEVAVGQPEEEEYAWMPPEIAAEAALAEIEAAQLEATSQPEAPEITPPEAEPIIAHLERPEVEQAPAELAVRIININTASLIELETLPGVGFIQAQNILNYRDTHGPFARLEDLLNVPGFDPLTLDEIRHRLTTGIEEKAIEPASLEALEPEMVDPDQAVLIQARNALIQENITETVARYSYLIKKERMLDTVIRDLYEALYHFPTDVSIWQTLGDAYVRNNQLQEALDAYIKAEELLR
jgi:competence ComEA-like helix-hairpin-helix protein